MSSYRGQNLFGSGAHQFHVGGLTLKHMLHEVPGGRGVRISAQGYTGRGITQTGDLLADTPEQLRGLMDAVEACLDGRVGELRDEIGRLWANVVMLSWEPAPMRAAGSRWAVAYRVQWLQLTP